MNTYRIDLVFAAAPLALALALTGLSGCGGCRCRAADSTTVAGQQQEPAVETETAAEAEPAAENVPEAPLVRPGNWDPVAFNRDRGNSGAIPESYLGDVNGPDGEAKHLGKHLPYAVDAAGLNMPEGYLALMWGDPAKGYAQHPNARKGAEAYPRGHWYDWVRVRKAVAGDAEEVETRFSNWPESGASDTGQYRVAEGGEIEANSGKDTIYLVKLPPDVKPGDTVRIWAHCLYHGEYVDFLEVK
jgi:hypothetical protein